MTAFSTEVIAAVFTLATLFETSKLCDTNSVYGADNLTIISTTVTCLMDSSLARLTVCSMTDLFTSVEPTIENFLASVLTSEFLATSDEKYKFEV